MNKQGKVRLERFYTSYTINERQAIIKHISTMILSRRQKLCNMFEYKGKNHILSSRFQNCV